MRVSGCIVLQNAIKGYNIANLIVLISFFRHILPMKKFLLALTLISPMINATSTDLNIIAPEAEITPEMIQFVARFKALHSFCIEEYAAIEQLFQNCGSLYAQTFDLLAALEHHGNQTLKQQCHELHDNLAPAIMNLNELLHRVEELNVQMSTFNAMIQQTTDYQEITKYLLAIAQEMHTIRVSLEAIKEYEAAIKAEALELSQGI